MRDVEMMTKQTPSPKESIRTVKTGSHTNMDDKERKKAEKNVQNAERRVGELEKQVADFEKEMAKSDFYRRADSQKVLDKYNAVKKELAAETEKWEAAMMELEMA